MAAAVALFLPCYLAAPAGPAPQADRLSAPRYQAAGTRRMAERLARIFRDQDWRTDPYKNGERAAFLREMLANERHPETRLHIRRALGEALLLKGASAEAVPELERALELARKTGAPPEFVGDVRNLLATACLRLGEQENCLVHHAADSCLFPIRASGRHVLGRGSRGAVRELTAMLDQDPRDVSARWLLNIAYMTLGEHPHKVPRAWVIPAEIFDSEYDIGGFRDVAPDVGLGVTGHSGGAIAEDFDGDGFIDVMLSSSGPTDQLRYFRNDGSGAFTDRTAEAGLLGEKGGLNLIHADYNSDGHSDVFVLRGGWLGAHGKYPNSLLRNNGDGTFDDVTEEAGLLSFHPTQTGAWADYDNDGRLDLFVGNESSAQEAHPSELHHNNGDGTFTDVAARLGLDDMGYVKGVAWGDFNNDGWPDLYVSRKGMPNILLRNDGRRRTARGAGPAGEDWSFTDVTRKAGVEEPRHSFATWFWDYDNDGWEDLLVTGYYTETNGDIGAFHLGLPNKAEVPRLYHNDRDGTFSDATKTARLDRVILPMGANFGDLDNDGFLDCYFGTGIPDYQGLLPNRMFRNDGGTRFQDVTTSGGFGHLQKGHGVAFADFDNDGDADVLEEMGGAYEGDVYPSVLFENPGHGNHWIRLRLEGVKTNRSALGARLHVRVSTAEGPRDIYRTVSTGGSFGGSPLEQHIGLGQARGTVEVEVRWPPSGTVQVFRGMATDQAYRIREGEAAPSPAPVRRVAFRRPAPERAP